VTACSFLKQGNGLTDPRRKKFVQNGLITLTPGAQGEGHRIEHLTAAEAALPRHGRHVQPEEQGVYKPVDQVM
jgi:hypothetical protein